MFRIICLLIGYALGHIQTSFILAKIFKKIDIRDHGTGNAGASNSLVVLGKKFAIPILLVDVGKSFLAFAICAAIFGGMSFWFDFTGIAFTYLPDADVPNPWLPGVYGSLGAIFGHMYPIYMRFRGGKSIACGIGLVLALNGWMALILIVIAITTVFTLRYVSPSSTVSLIALPVLIGLFDIRNQIPWGGEVLAVGYFITVFLIYRHKNVIKKFLNGNEKRLWTKAEDIKA
ncbi:MAG: glycerol-3-phosphate 1-O-acyltransferase PlsY [Defluviitaleaceae bacterium]|nr:glycerol-3-phosphate 1-O-acyltransferase PlsY [Defluviitaleaceae bacterium]